MPQRKWIGLLQAIVGLITTLLVVISYFQFSTPLRLALIELDGIVGKAETEINTAELLLKDIDSVAESIANALPAHQKTLSSVRMSASEITRTITAWQTQIPGVQSMASDAAHICDTFASQLPIRIPAITLETKRIAFELPEVIPKTRSIDIQYPTATLETSTKKISYPDGAKAEMKDFSQSLGRVAGRSLGSIGFRYPSDIKFSKETIEFNYPKIVMGTAVRSVTIPDTPEFKMKDYSFDVPEKLNIAHRELMKDEKALLEKASIQLTEVGTALDTTQNSLEIVKSLLDKDLVESLDESRENLDAVGGALGKFRTERLPSVLNDLEQQRLGLNRSRGVFDALAGLIPVTFIVVALTTAVTFVSGCFKLFAGAKSSVQDLA